MSAEVWFALVLAHVLGAMSPGPSLALILRNTLTGGRRHGVITGIGHGVGFGVYATLVATSLVAVLAVHPATNEVLRWVGIAVLVYLGTKILRHALTGPYDFSADDTAVHSSRAGFLQGFALAIFNPKILAWMLAVYAPFLHGGLSAGVLAAMVLMGMIVDGGWYVIVATVLSHSRWIKRLRRHAHHIDMAMGVVMFGFALLLLFRQ